MRKEAKRSVLVRLDEHHVSIKIVRFLMKTVGFWTAKNKMEGTILKGLRVYMIIGIVSAIYTASSDFILSTGDIYSLTHTACSAMPVIVVIAKLATFLYFRKNILKLLKFTQDHFWLTEYDEFSAKVFRNVDKKGGALMGMFMFFVTGVIVSYAMVPIIDNIGKNESERNLPFNIWIGVPVWQTPYFEIAFVMEGLALVYAGVGFCCFDSFLGLLNMHAAAQFRILNKRLQGIFEQDFLQPVDALETTQKLDELKKCIVHHQTLIAYVNQLEHMFTYSTLCQLLISSAMICVVGFQVFVARGPFLKRLTFIAHINGSSFQLFVITLTATELITESEAVREGAYSANWEQAPVAVRKHVRMAILMMMLRSSKPCCLTAAGFFPVSLNTFMAVLSTATSYFTLLRKFDTDLDTAEK